MTLAEIPIICCVHESADNHLIDAVQFDNIAMAMVELHSNVCACFIIENN